MPENQLRFEAPTQTDNDPAKGPSWILPVPTAVVGRGTTNDASPPDVSLGGGLSSQSSTVSRRHARFTFDGHDYLIEDLASLNGSRVNGLQLQPFQPYRLEDGDHIELAGLRFLFVRRNGDAVLQLVV